MTPIITLNKLNEDRNIDNNFKEEEMKCMEIVNSQMRSTFRMCDKKSNSKPAPTVFQASVPRANICALSRARSHKHESAFPRPRVSTLPLQLQPQS